MGSGLLGARLAGFAPYVANDAPVVKPAAAPRTAPGPPIAPPGRPESGLE